MDLILHLVPAIGMLQVFENMGEVLETMRTWDFSLQTRSTEVAHSSDSHVESTREEKSVLCELMSASEEFQAAVAL